MHNSGHVWLSCYTHSNKKHLQLMALMTCKLVIESLI